MIEAGELAPDFEAPTSNGTSVRLSSFRGRTVVLYFYPKAGSLGCTRESRSFAAQYPRFRDKGVEVVGVSVDDLAAQQRFAADCRLPFPLVADPGKAIARKYGVLGAFGYARRVTFVIDPEGRVQRVVASPLPGRHSDAAAELLSGGWERDPPAGGNR